MTIGIAAYGPNAGLAVFKALRVVEEITQGCIGGFVSFACISGEGELLRSATQRGGTSTLFIDADLVGADPPAPFAASRIAALMSSGPDRPEPLEQFVAGNAKSGLVTGHRFAHQPGISGTPFNCDVLQRMRNGKDVVSAVDAVIDENLSADVGLIAVDIQGRMHARNSDRVLRRPDLGTAQQIEQTPYAMVSILHNAIYPLSGTASIAAEVAMETMHPVRSPTFWIEVTAGIRVTLGDTNSVEVDSKMQVTEVQTTDASLLHGNQNGAAIYIGSQILHRGEQLGYTITEPYVVLNDGVIESLSGQPTLSVGCRKN